MIGVHDGNDDSVQLSHLFIYLLSSSKVNHKIKIRTDGNNNNSNNSIQFVFIYVQT
jgi:hypothetical protein